MSKATILKTALAMLSIDLKNRMNNTTFCTAMKCKLRLPTIKDHHHYVCCGRKHVDPYRASNIVRDGILDILKHILFIPKLINSGTQMEKEVWNIIVKSLPALKPFDLSIRLDHLLSDKAWCTPFSRIGFDVHLIHPPRPSSSNQLDESAQHHELDLRLREGEKMKFARSRSRMTGGKNEITKRTLSAHEVTGKIMDANFSFIPIAIGAFGEIGRTFLLFSDEGSFVGDGSDELDEIDWNGWIWKLWKGQ